MVDRWEGIVRACFSGTNCPARVMASLVFCPRSRTLQKPSKNAVLFMGDCVQGSGNPTIERLSRLETLSSILLSKLGDPLANVWVVEASRFNDKFACYEGFLSSMSSHGEPLSYEPHDFPASRATTSLLHSCLVEVNKELAQGNTDYPKSRGQGKGENQEQCEEAPHSIPKTLFFGFSKGGVVLNQLLSEMSYAANQSIHDHLHVSTWEIETVQKENAQGKSCVPEQALLPTTNHELLVSIVAIHYVDVGLNCPGAYQTDATVLENVAKAAAASSTGLHLGFHGTPRQWKDLRRPWIAFEKDYCIKYLRMIALREDSAKLNISEKLYFEHKNPSLQMHFEILECFQLDELVSLP